jgi:hypothetical protein
MNDDDISDYRESCSNTNVESKMSSLRSPGFCIDMSAAILIPAGSRFRPRSTSLADGREDGVKRSAQPRPVETISPIADGGYALRTAVLRSGIMSVKPSVSTSVVP